MSTVGAVATAGGKMKLSFTKSVGKRKAAESSLTFLTPSARRQATITPLASTSPGITRASNAASHGRVMLINYDGVPLHCPHRTSVILPVYKNISIFRRDNSINRSTCWEQYSLNFMEDSCRHYRLGLRSNKLLVI